MLWKLCPQVAQDYARLHLHWGTQLTFLTVQSFLSTAWRPTLGIAGQFVALRADKGLEGVNLHDTLLQKAKIMAARARLHQLKPFCWASHDHLCMLISSSLLVHPLAWCFSPPECQSVSFKSQASSSSLQYSSKRGLGSELALESAKTVKLNSQSHYVTTCHRCACLSCFQCRALLPIFSQAFTCMVANPSRPTKLCLFNMYPIYAPITLKVVGGMGETQLNTIPLDMLLPSLARNH